MYRYAYQLLQYFITEKITDIKYVALFNGQYNNVDMERPIPYPAVLVEFEPTYTNYYPGRIQNYEVNVIIHVATEITTGFDRGDERQDNSLEHLDILDNIFANLDNICTADLPSGSTLLNDNFVLADIQRTGMETNANLHPSIRVSRVKFKFNMTDGSAVPRTINGNIDTLDVVANFDTP